MPLRRLALATAFLVPALLSAQQVRGVIRDSASGLPIPGAVIMAYGEERAVFGRALSDEQGRYRIIPSAQPRTIRVMRIGFRPTEVAVAAGQQDVDVRLTIIPTLLERVEVIAEASGCPRRNDRVQTAGLLDQARSALLATIVAREAEPATVTRIRFERRLDANGDRVESQTVRLETADRATVSFNAAQTAVDFAERGFSVVDDGRRTFYGPDADVLLDDGFGRAYCFRIADRDPSRPRLVGLGFTPATRKGGRADIDGALWVDTVSRRLSHVEFKYVGLDELSEGLGAGGTVWFREVAPSIVLIDRWALRVVGGRESDPRNPAASAQQYSISEIGGELADASWPGGRRWSASLGGLAIVGTSAAGRPSVRTQVALLGTDYVATTDSLGRAEFSRLVPGPYRVAVLDPKLSSIGLDVPTDLSFTAVRDSVHSRQVVLPTAEEFAASVCRGGGRVAEESAWLIGRVGNAAGAPVGDAKWSVSRSAAAGWVPIAEGGSSGTSGIFSHCRNLKLGETVQVKAWRSRESPAVSVRVLSDRLTVLPVKLPTAVARGRGAPTTLRGEVRDSATNSTVAGAFVELTGTRFSAFTDTAGNFAIDGIAPGEYTAEIRTGLLDSLGAVGRSTIDFTGPGTPVRLFVPAARDLLASMCGPAALPGTGALIGTFSTADGSPLPANLRAVAEWREAGTGGAGTTAALAWLRARADSGGRYRICGIPAGSGIVVRTQTDSGATMAAKPLVLSLSPGEPLRIADITLAAGMEIGAAYSGLVIADSTDEALAGAEVVFADMNRIAVAASNGSFRLNDVPPGTHRVTIRRAGYRPITADVVFAANQTVDHRIVMGRATAALAAVQVTESKSSGLPDFDDHRKLGMGKFLTREDLEKQEGRRLGDIMGSTPTMNAVPASNGSHAWLLSRRMPARITHTRVPLPQNANPTGGFGDEAERKNGLAIAASQACGSAAEAPNTAGPSCLYNKDDMREAGYYCPQGNAEEQQGIRCGCYAQVYVDGRLMNKDRPTEPFDLNSLVADDVEGVEWYSSPSTVPARYSSLNSPCGVMAIWTRRSREKPLQTQLRSR